MTDSTDVEVRCKGCARRLADVTVRIEADDARVLGTIRWALGLVRCPACQDTAQRR